MTGASIFYYKNDIPFRLSSHWSPQICTDLFFVFHGMVKGDGIGPLPVKNILAAFNDLV